MTEYVMNEAEAKLVEALESGRYQQGVGRLREGEKFCCLGVACDISGLGAWVGDIYKVGPGPFDGNSVYLPEVVQKWLGWSNSSAQIEQGDKGRNYLAHLNDDGVSFAEIAKIIRAGKVVKA